MEGVPSRLVSAPDLGRAPPLHLNRPLSAFRAAAPHRLRSRRSLCVASFGSSLLPGDDVAGEDVLKAFLVERRLNGDAISKASDMLWRWGASDFGDAEDGASPTNLRNLEEVAEENIGGFLKLTKTREWIVGDNTAPLNRKLAAREWQNDTEKRKKINIMKYEALKREMMLLTAGIGAACTGYCLVTLSLQVAISYALGVLLRIGIRSEDLKHSLERIFKGSGIALSSPRLVIPAAIYGCWALSNHFSIDYFQFQLVPAMFGLFAYKAAALVQVYRDNEDLKLVFPENEGDPSDS